MVSSSLKIFANAKILNLENGDEDLLSVVVRGNRVEEFVSTVDALYFKDKGEFDEIIDCNGHIMIPGLIDMQVHFRDPGQTHKESIATGSAAAAAGGITSVVCQPNTVPILDSQEAIQFVETKAAESGLVNIMVYAAATKGSEGKTLSPMSKLAESDTVVGFTDDGLPVLDSAILLAVLQRTADLGLLFAQHAEDLSLSRNGCINLGIMSEKLRVKGIPAASETIIVERDLLLCEELVPDARYHLLHVSTAGAIDAVRRAKSKGVRVTCEATPHHFILNEEAVDIFGTNAKMNPPLRSERDRLAVIEGLKDGTIDCIATDHAPHDFASKNLPIEDAAFGITGVETMLPLSLELRDKANMSLADIIKKMTINPANALDRNLGSIKIGSRADLTIIDPDMDIVINSSDMKSKSKNTPFHGHKTKGKALLTVCGGRITHILTDQIKRIT